jgi:hypothetical protein
MAGRAVHRDLLTVWEDNIDLGEGIIRIHLLNLICAVHLRQAAGFKHWQTGRFKKPCGTTWAEQVECGSPVVGEDPEPFGRYGRRSARRRGGP